MEIDPRQPNRAGKTIMDYIPAAIDKLKHKMGGGVMEEPVASAIIPEAEAPKTIDKKALEEAVSILKKYKDGKRNLEERIVEEEQWWKLRHWDIIRNKQNQQDGEQRPEPTSAFLFNSLSHKHADFMDNAPICNVLPRERDDEHDADTLSSILPVIFERNNYEETFSNASWYKLKHGVVAKGIFWNNELEDGMGDIDIRYIDLLNVFYEPAIRDIQASQNLFIVDLKDDKVLESEYPQLKGKLGGGIVDVKQYVYDDNVDTSDKSVVVDWYYKKRNENGKVILHYCKFVGTEVIFASENEPAYQERGFYDHGKYPIVFDVLFPEEGTPVGFGYISIMKSPQLYIDKLSQVILENAAMSARPRFWASKSLGINEDEFLDWSKPIVHVEGQITDEKLQAINFNPVPANVVNILQMKIEELKETSANRDFNQGGTGSGVTSGAALAVLSEAGNKTSRDMIAASYRAFTQECYLAIELIRQFYDEERSFRITGERGNYEYVTYSNANLKGKPLPPAYAGQELEPNYQPAVRRPVFDIVIKPQKKSPYNRLSQNELGKELYGLGVFNPQLAEQTLGMLEMMDFDGIEKVKDRVQMGQTLQQMVMQMRTMVQQMGVAMMQNGINPAPYMMAGANPAPMGGVQPTSAPKGDSLGQKVKSSQESVLNSYGEQLVQRAKPDMDRGNG